MIPDIMGFDRAAPFLFAAFALAFLIGSTPIGVMIPRLFGARDPRVVGSGNIGATNVLRSAGPRLAALVLVLDVAKGALPVLAAHAWLGPTPAAFAGAGAFFGHCFSVFLAFRGGKGVATGFGVLLAWRWEVALIAAGAWLLAALATRRSSPGALTAIAVAFIALPLHEEWTYAFAFAPMALASFWRHRSNIGRLARGAEPKISLKRAAPEAGGGAS